MDALDRIFDWCITWVEAYAAEHRLRGRHKAAWSQAYRTTGPRFLHLCTDQVLANVPSIVGGVYVLSWVRLFQCVWYLDAAKWEGVYT